MEKDAPYGGTLNERLESTQMKYIDFNQRFYSASLMVIVLMLGSIGCGDENNGELLLAQTERLSAPIR